MPQVLNRLLSLDLDTMNIVFDAFGRRMEDATRIAEDAGTLDHGMETLRAQGVKVVSERVVHTDAASGADTTYLHLELTHPTKTTSFPEVKERIVNQGGISPFVKNIRSGNVWAVVSGTRTMTDSDGNIQSRRVLQSPTGRTVAEESRLAPENDFFTPMTEKEAATAWANAIAQEPKTYKEDVHIISGTLLPVWDRLPLATPKIVRVMTDDGRTMLGRKIFENDLSRTLEQLGAEGPDHKKISVGEAIKVIKNRGGFHFGNNWRVKESLVAGEQRTEIIGPDLSNHQEMDLLGIFRERIQYQTRYFIPANRVEEIVTQLAETRDITRLTHAQKSGNQYSAESAPTKPLTLEELNALPMVEKVTGKDGSYVLHFKRGISIPLKQVRLEGENRFLFTPKGERLFKRGWYDGKGITITQFGDGHTAAHEIFHFAEDIGLITSPDKILLNREAERLAGKTIPLKGKAEARAKLIEKLLRDRSAQRGTRLGSIVQKLQDFADKLVNVFRRTVGGVVRDFEAGAFAKRDMDGEGGESVQYSYMGTRDFAPGNYPDSLSVVHKSTSVSHLRKHPDFEAAKYHGDAEAAARIVKAVVKTRVLDALRAVIDPKKPVYFIPVTQIEGTKTNALPISYAEYLAQELNGERWSFSGKINRDGNTDATLMARLRNDQVFEGEMPPKGSQVVIVDDTYTSGNTLAALLDHAYNNGNISVAATTLAAGRYQNWLKPSVEKIQNCLPRQA